LAAAVVLTVTPGSEFQALVPWRAIGAAVRVFGPRERVLTDDWTGAAMLALHPAMLGRVGFDVRTEQYTAGELSAMWAFFYAKGAHWQRVLNRYRVVVVSRSRFPLAANALARLPGWRVLYNGRDGIVVQRIGAAR
jgi:hypothetical protein